MKNGRKTFSLCLSGVVAVGVLVGMNTSNIGASLPDNSAYQVYDGVNFNVLSTYGNHFYYGEFKHPTALQSGNSGVVIAKETTATPILWRIMGEEGNDENITVLSEYILDTSKFDDRHLSNSWESSTINSKLNEAGGIIDAFNTVEKNNLKEAEITTVVGFTDEILNHTGSKLYIPSIVSTSHPNDITWYGKANPNVTSYVSNNGINKATLKNGMATEWWLRTPVHSHRGLAISTFGDVIDAFIYYINGLRPVMKLDPKSVIFISEVKADADIIKGETLTNINYISGTNGTINLKLTLLGRDALITLGNVPSNKTIVNGDGLHLTGLTPSKTSSEYTVNYKIVGTTGNGREILKYGTTPATAITNVTMATEELAAGNYIAYVWLQKHNETTSHEGYDVQSFNLTVNLQVPVITSSRAVSFTEDQQGSFTVTASNDPISYSYTGILPNGVSFNTSTGLISGTPAVGTSGTYQLEITASNAGGTSSVQFFTLTIIDKTTPIIKPLKYTVFKHFEEFKGKGTVSAQIEAPRLKFSELYIGGNKVNKEQYTVKEGSTVITLSESYLKTLENKKYDVMIVFSDGAAASTLKVSKENVSEKNSLKTGDNSNVILLNSLLISAGVAFVLLRKRVL